MTRESKIRWAVGGAVFALAAVTAFWLADRGQAPTPGKPSPRQADPPPAAAAPPAAVDPQALAEVREAYRKALAEKGPPGMLPLMQGHGEPAEGLPPLTDPFVTPARFNPDPGADLPPLPPELAARPELLPPPDESPAAGKAKEAPADDLPPLPPVKKP